MELTAIGNEQKREVRRRYRELRRSPVSYLLFKRNGVGSVAIRSDAGLVFKVRTPELMKQVSCASKLIRIFDIPQALVPFRVSKKGMARLGVNGEAHVQLYKPMRLLYPLLWCGKLPTHSFGVNSYVAMEFTADIGATDLHGYNISIGWIECCRPSFRNTCCVKFPLFANVLHLYPFLPDLGLLPFGPPVERYVGVWDLPLETLLGKIQARENLPPEVIHLARSLQKSLNSI